MAKSAISEISFRGLEVDFVVQVGGELALLDAKVTELPTLREARGLLAARKVLGSRARRAALVSAGAKTFPLGEGVEVVNGWRLPAWLEGAEGPSRK